MHLLWTCLLATVVGGTAGPELKPFGPREIPWCLGSLELSTGPQSGLLTISVGAPGAGNYEAHIRVHASRCLRLAVDTIDDSFGDGKTVWRLPHDTASVREWHLPFDIIREGRGEVRISSKVILSTTSSYESEEIIPVRVSRGQLQNDSGHFKSRILHLEGQRFGVIQEWLVPLEGTEIIRPDISAAVRARKAPNSRPVVDCIDCNALESATLTYAAAVNGEGHVTSIALVRDDSDLAAIPARKRAESEIRTLQYERSYKTGRPVTDVVMVSVLVRGNRRPAPNSTPAPRPQPAPRSSR
jgi:hypothetical protein